MSFLLIKNARIEVDFIYKERNPTKTKTVVKDILIKDDKIIAIENEIEIEHDTKVYDAHGNLIIPSLREMHIHVDKTYFSGPWKACKPMDNGILTRIEEEKKLLPKQLPYVEERAEEVIRHYISQGHTHIRSHCNIDQSIKLENLKKTLKVFNKFKNYLTYEIVAFPQHGLLRDNADKLMREAMELGADLVGGVDPATIDRDVDLSLQAMFKIATDYGKGIDIHIHDPDNLGEYTFLKLIDLTHKHNLKGKVTISHALSLGDLKDEKLTQMIELLNEAKIDITSIVPINRPTIPFFKLDKHNIPVSIGHDSLTDHWNPFGTGNTIERMSILAERFNVSEERELHEILKFGTGGITPLDNDGNNCWPNVGDKANFIIANAGCTAELIARRKSILAVGSKGKIVYDKVKGVLIDE